MPTTWFKLKFGRQHVDPRHSVTSCEIEADEVVSLNPPTVCVFVGHLVNGKQLGRRFPFLGANNATMLDEEIVAGLLCRLGISALSMLEGCFAGAILLEGYFVAFTGKSSGPPLYYRQNSFGATVATSLRLIRSPSERILDFEDFSEDLLRENPKRTAIPGVLRLLPGNYIVVKAGEVVQQIEYFRQPLTSTIVDLNHAADEIHSALRSNFENYGQTHSPSCLISGGVDSSIIALYATKRYPGLQLLSLGTSEHNEFDAAREVAEYLSCSNYREYVYDESQILEILPKVILSTEQFFPTYIEYLCPVYLGIRESERHGSETLFTGYGSDILFGGFARDLDVITDGGLIEKEYQSSMWSGEMTSSQEFKTSVIHPFFESNLVNCALSISPHLKFRRGREKFVLRKSVETMLPGNLVWRKKIGIHQSNGTTNFFSDFLRTKRGDTAETTEVLKRRLFYAIFQRSLYDDRTLSPDEVIHLSRAIISSVTLS